MSDPKICEHVGPKKYVQIKITGVPYAEGDKVVVGTQCAVFGRVVWENRNTGLMEPHSEWTPIPAMAVGFEVSAESFATATVKVPVAHVEDVTAILTNVEMA